MIVAAILTALSLFETADVSALDSVRTSEGIAVTHESTAQVSADEDRAEVSQAEQRSTYSKIRGQFDAAMAGWIAQAQNNIVGLRDAAKVSNPALVQYSSLLSGTDEMRRIKRDKIDPDSPEGVQLRNAAQARVSRGCTAVMTEIGYCSVWKSIRHTDGRRVPDVTSQVRERL